MDESEYSSLVAAMSAVPDPRKARGKRYGWSFLMTLVSSAVASGQKSGRGIAQWIHEHAESLVAALQPARATVPSEATIHRTLRNMDTMEVERRIGQFIEQRSATDEQGSQRALDGTVLRGQSIDGKTVRGALAHGRSIHLVSLVRHGSGAVLSQMSVTAKSNEIVAAPELLAGRNLVGTVTTMDALLAQRKLLQAILAQGGHYLVAVKGNQPQLYADIELLFREPPVWADGPVWDIDVTVDKAHGRLERRTLVSSAQLNDYLRWPGVGQVLRRTCRRTVIATGAVSEEVTFGVTSLPPNLASARQLALLWRGHWTIENRLHYVRDVTFGEDAGQAHVGSTPQTLAAVRNALIILLRLQGWTYIADALRHLAARPARALALVSPAPT